MFAQSAASEIAEDIGADKIGMLGDELVRTPLFRRASQIVRPRRRRKQLTVAFADEVDIDRRIGDDGVDAALIQDLLQLRLRYRHDRDVILRHAMFREPVEEANQTPEARPLRADLLALEIFWILDGAIALTTSPSPALSGLKGSVDETTSLAFSPLSKALMK